jgi:acetyl esterase/lipase
VLHVSLAIGPARAADGRVKPGAEFVLEFAELGEAEHGGTVRMGVYIPRDYDRQRSFPLLAWLGGGRGSHTPRRAKRLAGEEGWVCVGLSYRKGSLWKTPWEIYKTMLDALAEVVPNIEPRMRVVGGFSSGGAAVTHAIGQEGSWFSDYFYAFMPGGAGWPMGGLEKIKGRPMLMFMGEKDSRFGGYVRLDKAARAAGVDARFLVFKGVGHTIPDDYVPEMRQWLKRRVRMRDLDRHVAAMRRALASKRAGVAARSAQAVLAIAEPEMDEHKEAKDALPELRAEGRAAAAKLLAGPASASAMRSFVRDWEGFECAGKVVVALTAKGEEELARLTARGTPRRTVLSRFLDDWEGFPVYRKALAVYDGIAAKELERVAKGPSSVSVRGSRLRRFIATWKVGLTVDRARTMLAELEDQEAAKELARIGRHKSAVHKAAKLKAFLTVHGKTSHAPRAKDMLEAAAGEILERIKNLRGVQRTSMLKALADAYGTTKAGREAKQLLGE